MRVKPFFNRHIVALCVGCYDTAIGLWPIFARQSFINITGLDNYQSIVTFIAVAWASLGILLLVFSKNKNMITPLGLASLAAGSSLALVECVLAVMQKIPPIFLLQAAAEVSVGVTWILTLSSTPTVEQIRKEGRKETATVSR